MSPNAQERDLGDAGGPGAQRRLLADPGERHVWEDLFVAIGSCVALIAFLSLGFFLNQSFGPHEGFGPHETTARTERIKQLGGMKTVTPALAAGEGTPLQAAWVAAPAFPAWKRLTLGTYEGVIALRAALDAARVRVGDSADEILGRPGFAFSQTTTDVDLVVVSVAELGFDDSTSLADIYQRAIELGLELCPAEVAPLLRLQYTDQPTGEFLNVGMRPIETYEGQPIALSVANAGTGPLLLGGDGHPNFCSIGWRSSSSFGPSGSRCPTCGEFGPMQRVHTSCRVTVRCSRGT